MSSKLNPFTGKIDLVGAGGGGGSSTLNDVTTNGNETANEIYIGSIGCILPGAITRSGDYISSVALTGGRTLTITRDVDGYIETIEDGTKTWTYTRNGSNQITSWAVA